MAVFDYGSARRLYLRILDPIVKDGYHAQDRFRHCRLKMSLQYYMKLKASLMMNASQPELRERNTGMGLTTLLICFVNRVGDKLLPRETPFS